MRARLLCLVLLAIPMVATAAPDLKWAETYDGGGSYTDEGLMTLTHPGVAAIATATVYLVAAGALLWRFWLVTAVL